MRLCLSIAIGLSLLAARGARADTIVLKNGRRIVALSVFEEGNKVRYVTSAGELTLPRSIVDHTEKGGAVPMPASAATTAANLAITPPAIEASGASAAVENGAVHDGAVDRDFLAAVATEARSGGLAANQKAAMAHHAAAQFELTRGDMEQALTDERTAPTYTPEDPALLLDVAYLHLRRSEYKQALDYLARARSVAPENPEVPKLAGWAYYGLNKLNQAVAEWRRALALRPDAECKQRWKKRSAINRKKRTIARTRAAISRCATAANPSPRWPAKSCARWNCILPPSSPSSTTPRQSP